MLPAWEKKTKPVLHVESQKHLKPTERNLTIIKSPESRTPSPLRNKSQKDKDAKTNTFKLLNLRNKHFILLWLIWSRKLMESYMLGILSVCGTKWSLCQVYLVPTIPSFPSFSSPLFSLHFFILNTCACTFIHMNVHVILYPTHEYPNFLSPSSP